MKIMSNSLKFSNFKAALQKIIFLNSIYFKSQEKGYNTYISMASEFG